ncbi:MAG: DUF885 domain-containing protein [Clostridia bacterium]|nr:DUF885 domain-containing protein [Clostridia bacterium]
MKKYICLILAIVFAAFTIGCREYWKKPSDDPTAQPTDVSETTPEATEAPEPTQIPEGYKSEADEDFELFDLMLFRDLVTSGADAYNQFIVSDPARFGIDPADVNPGWGELSYDAHIESIEYYRDMLSRMELIDYDTLSENNKHAYDAIMRWFDVQIMYEDYYYYDEPLEPVNGDHSMLPLTMICLSIRNADDVEMYLTLIEDMARYLGQIEQFEVEKAEHGLFMCETALDQVIESCRNFAANGEDSFLISYFEEIIEKAKEYGYTDDECELLRTRNRTAVLEYVLPAYSKLADTLEAHRGDCTPFVGAADRGEDAKAYFELDARYEGATMEDMDRIAELLEAMGKNCYMDMYRAIINGPDDILDRYGEDISFGSVDNNVEWLKGFIEKYYPELPDFSLKYIEVPEDIAEDFSPAAYLNPGFDDYYNNVMLINPTSENADDLLTVAHETLPGHMYQFLYTRSRENMSLSQQVLEPTGYAEAWTVFTEDFVAKHCDDIGREFCVMMNSESTFTNVFLPAYISIKVNYYGWDIDDVSDYLEDYGISSAADIFYEYAVTMPSYAMSYAIGYSYLSDIYAKAAPATEADHKEFFAEYLSYGPSFMDIMYDYMNK